MFIGRERQFSATIRSISPSVSPSLSPSLSTSAAMMADAPLAVVETTCWMKILTVEFGSTVFAVSTVLAVFMMGMALGSYLLGRSVDAGRRPLVLYALMEAVLGIYAVLARLLDVRGLRSNRG